jgi:type I restriction enzyme R subunit
MTRQPEQILEENLIPVKLESVIGNYLFTERKPLTNGIIGILQKNQKILERTTIIERVTNRISSFVDTFVSSMAE